MSHIVTLAGNFTESAIYPFVRAVVTQEGKPVAPEVIFDFRRLSWIDGTGLTDFCNTLEWLRAMVCNFLLYKLYRHKQAINYLDDCGFFKEYLGEPLSPKRCFGKVRFPSSGYSLAKVFGGSTILQHLGLQMSWGFQLRRS